MRETIGRLTARVGSGLSRFWNVVRFGGRWHTTTSARCYREAWLSGDGNESLTGFKDRLRSAGARRVSEVHPNAIFVCAGVMGAEHQHCR